MYFLFFFAERPRKALIRKKIQNITARKPIFKTRSSYVAALYFLPMWEILKERIPKGERAKAKKIIKNSITLFLDAKDFDEGFRINKNRLLSYLENSKHKEENAVADLYAKLKAYPYAMISMADFFILYRNNAENMFKVLKEVFRLSSRANAKILTKLLKTYGFSKREYDLLLKEIRDVLVERQQTINKEFETLMQMLSKLLHKDKEFKRDALNIRRRSPNKQAELLTHFAERILSYFLDVVARHVKTKSKDVKNIVSLLKAYYLAKTPSTVSALKKVFSYMAKIARHSSLKKSYRNLLRFLKHARFEKTKKFLSSINEKEREEIITFLNYAKIFIEPMIRERLILLFGPYGNEFYQQIVANSSRFYKEQILPTLEEF